MTTREMEMRRVALFLILGSAISCADEQSLDVPEPALLSIPASTVSVGSAMTFYGADFFPTLATRTDIQFDGQFTSTTGQVEPVHGLRVRPHREDGNTLVWTNIGPVSYTHLRAHE